MRVSLGIIRTQPGLVVLPLMAFAASALVGGLVALVDYETRQAGSGNSFSTAGTALAGVLHIFAPVGYLVTAAGLVLESYIAVISRAVIASRTMATLEGRPVTNGQAFSHVMSHSVKLFYWSVINAIVTFLTRLLGEEAGIVGRILQVILNVAWSVMTFFVVPVILFEDVRPFAAIRRSAQLFRQR